MSDKVLLKSLPYLLGVVAAGTGVSIKTDPNARTAATNGKVVILPPLPYTGGELAIYSLGYLVHEAGHLRSTDFTVLAGKSITSLQKMLINILEDIRIERLINGVFPGARHWLNALTKKFVETQKQGVIDPDADLTTLLVRYLQDWLYESVLGYSAVKGIGVQQRALWQSKVSPELASAVEQIALAAAWASTTQHVFDAASEIIELIQQEAEQANSAKPDPKPEDCDDVQGPGADACDPGQPGDADGSDGARPQKLVPSGDVEQAQDGENAAGDQPDDEPVDQSPSASGSSAPGGSAAGQGDVSNQLNSQDAGAAVRTPQAYAQALEAVLQSAEIEQGADRSEVIRQEMNESIGAGNAGKESNFYLPTVLPAQGVKSDHVALERVRAASTALRYRMEEFLQANTMKRYSVSESGKRLTRDAARRLSMCDLRIFQKRTLGQKIDTAVHVLIDISGSMIVNNRCGVAVDAALALGLALDEVDGVKYSVSAFPFHSHDVIEMVYPGESMRNVAFRFANLSPNGTTPLDKGLIQAHTSLMTTDAARRVCLVITDGDPDDAEAAKMVVSMGESEGIEHMAIGIECSVSHITKNACVVMDLADLPKQVMGMMQSVILLPKAA